MNRQIPVVTTVLAERFMCAENAVMSDWLIGLQQLPSNPYGVEVKQFGGATALIMRALPTSPLYNRVMCMGPSEVQFIEEVKGFYHSQGVPLCLDLNPYYVTSEMLQALASSGFYQSTFHTILYGQPSLDVPAPGPAFTIREAQGDEMDILVHIYEHGFGNGELIKVLHGRPGWRLYVLLFEGIYAAINLTYFKDGIASSVDTTTLPTLRGRGIQQAFINYRLRDAAQEGYPLLLTQTALGSVSQRNWQRCGLCLSCNHVWWMEV